MAGRVNGVYAPARARTRWRGRRRTAARTQQHRELAPAAAPCARPPRDAATRTASASAVRRSPRGKEFVDLDEDLTLADLANAAQEGFDSVELLKRYSTVGMGPSQGKLSNLERRAPPGARDGTRSLAALGLTTARPPWQPVSLGALAGARLSPLRRTPLDAWHEAHGAQWMPAGNWRRPAYYARQE